MDENEKLHLASDGQDYFQTANQQIVSALVKAIRGALPSTIPGQKTCKFELSSNDIENLDYLLRLAELYPGVLSCVEHYKSEALIRERMLLEMSETRHAKTGETAAQRRLGALADAKLEANPKHEAILEDFKFFRSQFKIKEPLDRTWEHKIPQLVLRNKYRKFFVQETPPSPAKMNSTIFSLLTEKHRFKQGTIRKILRRLKIKLRK